jgi:hypothetical protein
MKGRRTLTPLPNCFSWVASAREDGLFGIPLKASNKTGCNGGQQRLDVLIEAYWRVTVSDATKAGSPTRTLPSPIRG